MMIDWTSSSPTCLDWTQEDTEEPRGNSNLWEESWDDDDINEDFSAQLKYVVVLFHHIVVEMIGQDASLRV